MLTPIVHETGNALQPAMTHEDAFLQAEGSSRLEGVDPTEYPEYLGLKERILAGEITSAEAIELLAAHSHR
jgi:hypothetical protein